jgi:hypothetical protein
MTTGGCRHSLRSVAHDAERFLFDLIFEAD